MTQPQVQATFCKHIIIIIIGSAALGGPWPPLCKRIAHCFKEHFYLKKFQKMHLEHISLELILKAAFKKKILQEKWHP